MTSPIYEVKFTTRFKKDFDGLADPELRARIRVQLDALRAEPFANKRLHGNLKGCFSLRVGSHRAVYMVDERSRMITLLFLGHRRGVYDRY